MNISPKLLVDDYLFIARDDWFYRWSHLVGGKRGAVMGGIGTIGVIVGAEIPMFLGSMIAGPLGGLVIKICR